MNAKEFYNLVVKMRKAQRDHERTLLTRHKIEAQGYEAQIDAEIKRVEEIQKKNAENQQLKML